MHMRMLASLLVGLGLLVPACLLEPEQDELEQDDHERDVLPPQPLPLEGSPTAYGMLRVVNELGFAALDREVGLDRQAAASILEHRAGPDAYVGTADDRFVAELAELDALYWLGEANLWTIQSHALLEGYVPQVVPEGCEPALAEAIDACRRFVAEAAAEAAGAEASIDVSGSCLEASEDGSAAAEHFVEAGLPSYREPALGYHALLCGGADGGGDLEVCALGVAAVAAQVMGACSEPGT